MKSVKSLLVSREYWPALSKQEKTDHGSTKKQMRPFLKRPHLFFGFTFGNYVSKIDRRVGL
jgi:hypothetical protein